MIHALPGMGADRRMYPAPWADLPNFKAHDWMHYSGEKTLADVALSMTDACGILDGDILVGSSLGGMIACEITKLRRIPLLYLVGSAVRKEEVSSLLTALRPLAQVAPIEWLAFSAGSIPLDYVQMFAGMDASFVRAMCSAIFRWEGLTGLNTRVVRIHGKNDLVIPCPEKVDLLLRGGHLISITHARQCVDYILADRAAGPGPSPE